MIQTGIRETINGFQAWFSIGNQTFHLSESVQDTDEESKDHAKFNERMIKHALEKLKREGNADYKPI